MSKYPILLRSMVRASLLVPPTKLHILLHVVVVVDDKVYRRWRGCSDARRDEVDEGGRPRTRGLMNHTGVALW